MRKKIIAATVALAGINCGVGATGMFMGETSLIFPIALISGAIYIGLFAWVNCSRKK